MTIPPGKLNSPSASRRGLDHSQPHKEYYNAPYSIDTFNGMPYRLLGRSGLRVSAVGLGTWKIGLPETGDGSRVDEKTGFKIFDRAVELGVTFWDTANRYNGAAGNSERVIGRWFAANPDQRRNIVLATKVFGGMDGRSPNHCRLSRTNILESVYACLDRLQVDAIDLLYFHDFDPDTPPEESLAAVEDLVRQDVVRYFGVSNVTLAQLRAYRKAEATLSVRTRIQAIQNQYDILNGESTKRPGVLAYAARERISFVAFSPLALGLLTERYLDLAKVGKGDRLYDEGEMARVSNKAMMARLHRLAALAHDGGLQLNQLALAYMLAQPGMGPAIPSSSSVRQLESNAAACKITLTEKQMRQAQAILAP